MSLQFEEGIEKTVRWYLENEEWLENVTSGDYQTYYNKNVRESVVLSKYTSLNSRTNWLGKRGIYRMLVIPI